MQHDDFVRDGDEPGARIRQVVLSALCDALERTRLPPMTVMGLLAQAVGSVYRELADAHVGDDACTCGWQPAPAEDIEALQAALAVNAGIHDGCSLRHVPVAGRA
jgi:hypothetical protein